MKEVHLEILLADAERRTAVAAAAALRRRGHLVRTASSAAEALELPSCDVIVCGMQLEDGSGLQLLAELRQRGSLARAVLLGVLMTPDEQRAALRLGACDILTKPCRLRVLVDAVERDLLPALPAARAAGQPSTSLRRTLPADSGRLEDALRELCALLMRHGVSPATRMRAASACAEILDNAARYAYPSGECGSVELVAELGTREIVVHVADQGVGFESANDPHDPLADTFESGLARAAALAVELSLDTAPGCGTRVTLRFSTYRVVFQEDEVIDLSELDWLPPALARRVLHGLRGGGAPVHNLSPALAVAVGRLLAGPSPRQRTERALGR